MDDGPRKSSRLQSYFMDEKDLIADLIGGAEVNVAKNFGRKLHQGQIFPELDRKSLMARVIKAAPETQELVTSDGEQSNTDIVSSWDSIDKRKAEYKDLVDNQIPQNREDIKIAKSYGDLRENAEYHMAKDNQKVLMRRKADHEKALGEVQGTDFKNVEPDAVKIGTIVTLESDGEKRQMTILGAWDSDPDNDVISYLSEMAQSLLGATVGDTVEVVSQKMTVKAIAAYNA